MPSLLAALKKKYPRKRVTKKKATKKVMKDAGITAADEGTSYYVNGKEVFLIPSGDQISKETIEVLVDFVSETIEHNDR